MKNLLLCSVCGEFARYVLTRKKSELLCAEHFNEFAAHYKRAYRVEEIPEEPQGRFEFALSKIMRVSKEELDRAMDLYRLQNAGKLKRGPKPKSKSKE